MGSDVWDKVPNKYGIFFDTFPKKVEEGRLDLDEIVFLGSGGRHHEVVLTFSLPQVVIKHVLYTWENKLLHHEVVTLQQLFFRP